MDKITRIHLAKIPYEISIRAQDELRKYLDEIREQLDPNLADEIMADIEVRITEILQTRNIKRNEVITSKDIDAIQEQLGSPVQFTDSDTKSNSKSHDSESKKLLRDTDGAYIGGVASGLGAYFGIDPIFLRIAFILLTFASGLGIALYILFWVLVPAAKSSSEKLQMSGQPVTAATLQRYRSSIQRRLGGGPNTVQIVITETFNVCVTILKVVLTIFSGLFSLFILAMLGVGSSLTFVYPFRSVFTDYRLDYITLGLLWVIGLSLIGLLVILVMRLWGQRSSHLKFTAITLLVALIIAIASTGAMGTLVFNHFSNTYGNNKVATALAVNNESTNITPTSLVIKSDGNLDLTYVTSDQAIHATYQAYPGLGKPPISITNNRGVLSVDSSDLSQVAPSCLGNLCKQIYLPIKVTLYGPSLSGMTDNNGATLWVNNENFASPIAFTASNGSTISINNSYAANMTMTATSWSSVQANNTSAGQATIYVDSSSSVIAPATNIVTATLPKNCNENDSPLIFLNGYSETVKLNGQLQTANELYQNGCVSSNNP